MSSILRTIRTPEKACPHCGYGLDAHSIPFSLDTPSEGDLSVCINCGGLLEFGKSMKVHALSEEMLIQVILEDPEAYAVLMAHREAVLKAKAERI